MQSVVTGQAPITLEWKIVSGRKQIKGEISVRVYTGVLSFAKFTEGRWHVFLYYTRYHILNLVLV